MASDMRRLTVLGWAGAVVVLLWIAGVAVLYAIQDRIVFQPDDRPLGDPPADLPRLARAVLETGDGLALSFWLTPPAPGRPVIVYFHGNGGNAGDRAGALAPLIDAGNGILLAEYRGYGGNPGVPSEDAFYADGALYLAEAVARFPGHPIVLWGESLGGGVATSVATDDAIDPALRARIAGLVLDAAFTSLRDIATGQYPLVSAGYLLRSRFDNLSRVSAIRVPVLIMHGGRDAIVSVEHGKRLFDAANEPKTGLFLPDVGHLAFAYDESGRALVAVETFLAGVTPGE